MNTYTILILPSTEKHIQKLPKEIRIAITSAITQLADNPRPAGCKKLKGMPAYRIRIGNYRIVYEIEDKILTVTVIAAAHRKDIYK